MNEDATARPGAGEAALSPALAACREALITKVHQISGKREAGRITVAQHRDQLHAVHAVCDGDCGLAEGGQQ